jgi:predicted O-methyltransferase YrrM
MASKRNGVLTLPFRIARRFAHESKKLARKIRETNLVWRYPLPEIDIVSLTGSEPEETPRILEQICMPHRQSKWAQFASHDDFGPLLHLLRHINARRVVELGTAHGNTIANICDTFPDIEAITVNAPVEMMTGEVTTFSLTADEIGKVYRERGFESRVVQVYQNTLQLDLSGVINKLSVDLVIIDACHDVAFVLNDFEKTREYVRPGGVVLFHDTHPSKVKHLRGSYVACAELRRRGFDVRHIRGTWWGIWVNGSISRRA